MTWRVREDCRLCGAVDLETVLELAPTPPANELVRAGDPPQELIPLYLARCPACGHVQLPVVVDPERLFGNYVYVSGTSPSFVEHFRQYAIQCIVDYDLQEDDFVVDIGSNDGTLLRHFRNGGMIVHGIDPAREIAARATQAGIATWPEFFTRATSEKLVMLRGHAALVVANNVFAHADDLREIALAVRDLLKPDGRFVFEVSYLVDVVQKTLFDTIYLEHLSYHSLEPLARFFESCDLALVDAHRVDTHGGSIRCVVAHAGRDAPSTRVTGMIKEERLVLADEPFARLRRQIDAAHVRMTDFFERNRDKRIVGFGAPAKLTTLTHEFGIGVEQIEYVVDDSPWKQGLLTPGSRIPIVPAQRLIDAPPDKVVVFAWNFAEQIAAKHPELAGKFVVPLPVYREM